MESDDDLAVLRRGLDQLTSLLGEVQPGLLDHSTPCEHWKVRDLVDHIVEAPNKFARMTRGESIDWSAPTPPAGDDPSTAFRSHADDLLRAWDEHQAAPRAAGLDWQCAELAVHTWDLATALRRPTDGLDPDVADRGLKFMRSSLAEDRRSPAFGPEQPLPAGADAYHRIAAFAGRRV